MKLHTRACDILGIEYPLVLAGMGGAATPELTAAVSNAGGLGVLGAAGCGPSLLREWIKRTRQLTDKPFGVDTLLPASVRRQAQQAGDGSDSPMDHLDEYLAFARDYMEQEDLGAPKPTRNSSKASEGEPDLFTKEFFEAQMDVIIDEAVPVYAAGLGNPAPWLDRLHYNGTKVIAVVGAVRHALQVGSSGIDLIVAQGHDAGGHNSPVGTMALIPQVVDAVGDLPVLAAGGITDGRGMAAAFMLGAEGVWLGSTFLAAEESGILEFQKQAIVDATEESTTVSRCVTGKPCRMIKSSWTRAWEQSDLEPLPMPYQTMISGPVMAAAAAKGRDDIAPGIAGQGIGMIKSVRPAKAIFEEIIDGAQRALVSTHNLVAD